MQIQLKQAEIEAALKMFIAAQGINIQGKQVDIAFIASRKANGMVADVSINDVVIPGFTDSVALAVVKPAATVEEPLATSEEEPVDPMDPVEQSPVEAKPEAEAAKPATVSSLFN